MHKGRLLALGTPQELKRLMRGAILEVRSSQPRKTATLLREMGAALSVGLFGDRVHVVTQEIDRIAAEVVQLLDEAGLRLDGLRVIEPSLEDVFISVLAEQRGQSL